jgi:D-sedoheptulose 7-phosphate isomerase
MSRTVRAMGSNTYNFKDEIKKHIEESRDLKHKIIDKHVDMINDIASIIIDAYKNNKKVIWFGNGGSAADAQHLSCELVSKFNKNRRAIPSLSLTTNTSILTSVSNDFHYDNIFERQVEALAQEGDILVGITTSGTSPNILKALKLGKEKGTINIAFTGEQTDKIKEFTDYLVNVPSTKTPRIQESHIMIGHIICDLVETTLFKDE